MLRDQGAVSVTEVETRFGVSAMTARRDLGELERVGAAKRTHGGAVLPGVSAQEDSFAHRLGVDADAKTALAAAALELIAPRQTIFLDCSSTTYYLARAIAEAAINVTVITNSVPVMDALGGDGRHGSVVGIGGALRRLTRSYVGPYAVHTIRRPLRRPAVLQRQRASRAGGVPDRRRRARGRGQARDDRAVRSARCCSSIAPSSPPAARTRSRPRAPSRPS